MEKAIKRFLFGIKIYIFLFSHTIYDILLKINENIDCDN